MYLIRPILCDIGYAALVSVLSISAFTDARSRTIPVRLVLCCALLLSSLKLIVAGPIALLFSMLGAFLVFFMFYLNARFLNGGAGDALMFPLTCLWEGFLPGLLICLIACVSGAMGHVIFSTAARNHDKKRGDIPMAPYLLFACFVFWICKGVSRIV